MEAAQLQAQLDEANAKIKALEGEVAAKSAIPPTQSAAPVLPTSFAKTDPPADDNDGDEDCDPNMKDKKKAAAASTTTPVPGSTTSGQGAPVVNIDATADLKLIAELGAIAGRSDEAGKFIAEGKTSADFRKFLLDARAEESAKTAINPSFGTFSSDSVTGIQTQLQSALANAPEGKKKSEVFEAVLRRNAQSYKKYSNEKKAAALTDEGAEAYVQRAAPIMQSLGLTGSF